MPTSGRANAKVNRVTTSGELRKTVTQASPMNRSGGTGETRNAASAVPRTSAPTMANRQSRSVPRKPLRYSGNSAISAFNSALQAAGGAGGRHRPVRSGPAGAGDHRMGRSAAGVGRRQRRRRRLDLADRGVPGGLVAAVGHRVLQGLVDEI